ncbi:hypothetical protein HII12_001765 [Brettanomyces bruxellensis]|uniref:Nucleolar protein 16 n=1 Tax=Dekkera bruxellensis TaxID=5007 RepID=A0A8H6BJV4_DEKBR|nr:hypothetical protein HII12_001765 [Brettanomyces bruxellensis]
MARSSVGKVSRRKKDTHKKIRKFGNQIIAENWDNKLTLSQNYERLGLKKNLKVIKPIKVDDEDEDPYDPANILEGTAKLIKNDDGKVVKVIYGTKKLDAEEQDSNVIEISRKVTKDSSVVKALEKLASSEVKHEKLISEREIEWLRKLETKYGDDYEAMKWDRKLNPFQESTGKLRKRFKDLHEFEERYNDTEERA